MAGGGEVPHVELSLSDGDHPGSPGSRGGSWTGPGSALRRWAEVVASAEEPCAVLNADGMIEASSAACQDLLDPTGGGPAAWHGRGLLDVLDLIDLTASGVPLAAWEAERIPPLLALATGNLARSLIRIRVGERTRTLDVIATPLSQGPALIGSLSFFHRI